MTIKYTSDDDDDYCEKFPAIRDFSRLPLLITDEMARDMEAGGKEMLWRIGELATELRQEALYEDLRR